MEGSEDDRVPIVGLLDNSGTNELDLSAPPQPFRKETVGRSLALCLVFQQKCFGRGFIDSGSGSSILDQIGYQSGSIPDSGF